MFEENFERACKSILGESVSFSQNNTPKLAYVFASPGAGKSSKLRHLLAKEFPVDDVPVIVEIDELKHFAPEEMQGKDRLRLVDSWYKRIIDKAFENGRSILIFRSKDMVHYNRTRNILKKAKDRGFTTEINFLAINREKSRLGMVYRYEKALKNMFEGNLDHTNYPRKPKFFYHYIYYKSLPETAKCCIKDSLVDKIRVFNRDGEQLSYINKADNSKSETGILNSIKNERERSWTVEEITDYNRQVDDVKNMMRERGASHRETLINNLIVMKKSYPTRK